MKPLNLDNSPCTPTSSNCVIWQGPNIDCINLCTGDSISTVVFKLAEELCTIMNQLDLTNLDLTCLKVGTNPPDTFSELIQILINKICNTPGTTNAPAALTDPCPTNCIVPIADCFKSGNQTTMLLLDYVQMIGEKVCSLVDQIDQINTSITNIDKRVTKLENEPDPEPYVLPSIPVDCTLADTAALPSVPSAILAGNSYKLDVILAALVNDDTHGYCALLSALGQPGNVTTAYQFQSNISAGLYVPVLASSPSLYNCGTAMQTEYTSWIASPQNLSESFINLWITVSDIRKAHKTYEVVAGNTSVNVATATTATACGNKDTVTVSANLPIVAPGTNITVTPTVASNVTTYTVAAKGMTVTDTTSIDLTLTTVGTDWNIKAQIVDTGWVDLLGFSWFKYAALKPQCRRIGNVVYFRGALMIPLTSGSSVIDYDYQSTPGTDTYGGINSVAPWTGTEGVTIISQGAIQFNQNLTVIPTSVVGNSENFDKVVFSNYILGTRMIRSKVPASSLRVKTTVTNVVVPSSGNYAERYNFSTTYTNILCVGGTGTDLIINFTTNATGEIHTITIVNPGSGYTTGDTVTLPPVITTTAGSRPTFTLTITTVSNGTTTPETYSSVLHLVTKIYITPEKKIGLQLLRDMEENAASSTGTPTGKSSYNTSMLNILQAPVVQDEFIPYFRRNTTPSEDIILGSSPDFGIQNTLMRYSYLQMTSTDNNIGVYPFSCNPNDPDQTGGFGWMQLDGMTAFLAPCNTDIKSHIACP